MPVCLHPQDTYLKGFWGFPEPFAKLKGALEDLLWECTYHRRGAATGWPPETPNGRKTQRWPSLSPSPVSETRRLVAFWNAEGFCCWGLFLDPMASGSRGPKVDIRDIYPKAPRQRQTSERPFPPEVLRKNYNISILSFSLRVQFKNILIIQWIQALGLW